MSDNFIASLGGACQEYFSTLDGVYRGAELVNEVIPVLPTIEGLANIKEIFQNCLDVQDCFNVIPDSIDATFKVLKPIKEFHSDDIVTVALTVGVLALDTLSIVAVAGGAKLIDLGKLAARLGRVEAFGINPVRYMALGTAIRGVYIYVLAIDAGKSLYKVYQLSGKTLTEDAARRKAETERREALWNVTRNTTRITLQVICIAGCSSIPILLAFGVCASVTGMAAKIVATDSMRHYFNPHYTVPEPTY